jgi:hypothetical protein
VLSFVEITAFRPYKAFFKHKISTNESTPIHNKSCDLQPGLLYLQIPTENHQYDGIIQPHSMKMAKKVKNRFKSMSKP